MKNWEVTAKRFIVFLDIMGFSNFVYRNDHSAVKQKMQLFSAIITDCKTTIETSSKTLMRHERPLETVVFSDSVLLISVDSSKMSLTNILLASQIFLKSCMVSRLPVKGAISYGTITADFEKSLFFGKGLIDAYRLGEQLHMYGIILDEKAERKMRELKIKSNYFCVEAKVPTKSGSIRHYAVDWMTDLEAMEANPVEIVKRFYEQVSGAPRMYLDNTIDFIENARS